jgi:hypothetical protein
VIFAHGSALAAMRCSSKTALCIDLEKHLLAAIARG